jgi:hypothetical protein
MAFEDAYYQATIIYKQTGGRKGDRQLEENKQTHRQANTQTGKLKKGRQYSRFTDRKEDRFVSRSADDKKLVACSVSLLLGL